MDDLLYLNNAATSHPKPPEVVVAVQRALTRPPGDAGRGGGVEDARPACRNTLARLLGVGQADHIALLPSATAAINAVVGGLLNRGDHVVTTVLEHNSVLRPLAHQERARQVGVTFIEPAADGVLETETVRGALTDTTALIVVTHMSNVTGAIQPIEDLAEMAAAAGIPLLIDASQSVGCVPVDHGSLPGRVFVAFAGHKGLLGPTGVGGLVVPDDGLPQTVVGGTGVRSESRLHPGALPLRHEAGTPNFPGIAGLAAGANFMQDRGVEAEGAHRNQMVQVLRDRLLTIKGIRLLPLPAEDGRGGIVAFSLEGWDPEVLGYTLRESFSIECRSGLHCAPRIHDFFGCGSQGTLRVSFGTGNRVADVDRFMDALTAVVGA